MFVYLSLCVESWQCFILKCVKFYFFILSMEIFCGVVRRENIVWQANGRCLAHARCFCEQVFRVEIFSGLRTKQKHISLGEMALCGCIVNVMMTSSSVGHNQNPSLQGQVKEENIFLQGWCQSVKGLVYMRLRCVRNGNCSGPHFPDRQRALLRDRIRFLFIIDLTSLKFIASPISHFKLSTRKQNS